MVQTIRQIRANRSNISQY